MAAIDQDQFRRGMRLLAAGVTVITTTRNGVPHGLVATASAMGRIAIPEMLRYRYDPGLATGSVAVAGTLGSLIPPSILMVIYAIFAEVSVSKALIAGVLPGILSGVMFALLIIVRCKLNPDLAPMVRNEVTWHERFVVLASVWPLPVLILGVIGGIYSGIVTSTEAAALGAFLAFVIAACQRRLTWKVLVDSVVDSLKGTASIFFIALGGILLSRFMAFSGLPNHLAEAISGLAIDPLVLVIVTSAIFIFLGMFLDSLGLMLLVIPVVLPAFEAVGADLIWFGVLVIKYLEIGLVTPPVGMNVYVIKSVVGDRIPLETIFKGVGWFIVADIVTLSLLIAFPEISLFLPRLMD